MRRAAALILAAVISVSVMAQTTKVRGRVTDADSGDSVPFAAIYFKGTTIGITADLDGYYTLETREQLPQALLTCQLLGYDSAESAIKLGGFTTVNFKLRQSSNNLDEVRVRPDNRKAKRMLANIEANRWRNDPDAHPTYSCDIYNKMELALTHPREQLKSKAFKKDFAFVFDYIDTSTVSGVPYLPVMISESSVRRQHTSNPRNDKETILGNRISGINPDANLLSQFTGSLHLKINFYRDFINSFDVEFPSPIQAAGLQYYNYYIVDSLMVDGRKTYVVHYHPKKGISSPALDGEMQIDCGDWALRSISAKMKHGGNVNWLRDVVYETEYRRFPDSTWFYKQDKLYADFSVVLSDSSRVMSVLGRRELSYDVPDFQEVPDIKLSASPSTVTAQANHQDEAYWDSVRPYPLNEREKNIYKMVDRVQDVPLYKTWYDIAYTLINGYYDVGPVGFGPYLKLISFNNLEGFRPRIGIHTSKDLSKKYRFTGYVAYGTKDRQVKGGLTCELLFRKEPTSKLTLDAHYDVVQLGRGQSMISFDNFISSLWRGAQKLCPETSYSALYEHEFSPAFNFEAGVDLKRYYANEYVPMVAMGTGEWIPSVAANEIHVQGRWSKDETVNRGHFIKTYVHTRYPVFTLKLAGSIPGIRQNDFGYFKPEFSVDWKFRIPPAGMSRVFFNCGTILGEVPYPLLHIHEGNVTNIMSKHSFSCMDYLEFASDTWATLFWYHNFNGFFFGKVPGLKKLKLREEFTFKMAYGHLSDRNRQAVMQFAPGMKAMDHGPYMEIGAGVSNILQIIRVDFLWRLTYREPGVQVNPFKMPRNFTVNIGLEFRF